jgi:hypothetical protein
MRTLRFLHSISFSIGLTFLLCGGIVVLTEKVVIYPHERSLPLLQLNQVETAGFKTLQKLPSLLGAGALTCLLTGGAMWRRSA